MILFTWSLFLVTADRTWSKWPLWKSDSQLYINKTYYQGIWTSPPTHRTLQPWGDCCSTRLFSNKNLHTLIIKFNSLHDKWKLTTAIMSAVVQQRANPFPPHCDNSSRAHLPRMSLRSRHFTFIFMYDN